MKFLCGNCKAKYQIADEKVSGRTLRMKCRRCGHDILIDGHSMPQSAPPGAAAPQRRTTSTVSVMPGPAPRAAGAAPAPALRPGTPGIPRPASRSKPPSGLNADFRRHVAAPPEVPQRNAPYDLWHAAIQDVPVGPMTRDELARKIDAGAVTAESLCWREGMDDWRPLGELPELANLLRRSPAAARAGRGRPPPEVPAPVRSPGSRQVPLPQPPADDFDDDGGEATRISDFTPPLSESASQPAIQTNASNTSPKILGSSATPATALPSTETNAHIQAPTAPSARGSSQMYTGIAVGMLGMIVLLGGPTLYKATWGSSEHTAPAHTEPPAAVAKVETPRNITPEPVAVTVDVPEETVEEKTPTAIKPPTAAKTPRPAKTEEKPATKALSDEQRKLLERMGGGANEPDLRNVARNQDNAGAPAGAALTAQQLAKVVNDNKTQLQRCYETALRAAGGKQDGAIKVSVNVVVGTSGSAKSVSTQGDGLGNMNDCIRSGVKRWRFPQSGGESEFAFPLVFQPGA